MSLIRSISTRVRAKKKKVLACPAGKTVGVVAAMAGVVAIYDVVDGKVVDVDVVPYNSGRVDGRIN